MADLSQDELWKIRDSSQRHIDLCNQRQWDQDAKADKWTLTLAAGSFGLSFVFIDRIVPLSSASCRGLLLAAWSCFAATLVIGLCGFMISSFVHSAMAREELKNVSLKLQGQTPGNRDRSVFFNGVALCGYASMLSFVGGVVCLLGFIAKNFAL
jgi:hypothetical protein